MMSWRHATSPSPTGLDANIVQSNVENSENKPSLSTDLLGTEAEGGATSHNSDTLKRRQQSCKNILRRFPGRVPVIVEKLGANNNGNSAKNNLKRTLSIMNYKRNDRNNHHSDGNDPDHRGDDYAEASGAAPLSSSSKRYKFLVPYDCTVGQFQWILRNKIEMVAPNRAIYLIVHRTLPHASCLMGELYRKYQNNDGYLYVYYSGENTFGGLRMMDEQGNIGLQPSTKLKNVEKFVIEKSRSKSFRRMAQIKFHAPEKNPKSDELQAKSSKSGTIFYSNKEAKQLEQAKSDKSPDEMNGNMAAESKQNIDEDLLLNKTELYVKQPKLLEQHVPKEESNGDRRSLKNSNFQQIFAKVKNSDFFIRSFGTRVAKMVRSSGGKIFGLKQMDSEVEKKLYKVKAAIKSLKHPRNEDPNEFVLKDDRNNDWKQPEWITPDPERMVMHKFLSWSHQQQSAILLMDDKILSKTMGLNYQREIFASQYSGTAFFVAKYAGRACLVKRINFERKYFDSDTDWINIVKLVCSDDHSGPETTSLKPFARVHEVFNWPSKSQLFIFMEILTNKTLHYRIKQREPLIVNQVRLWTSQLLNGISYLQNLAIIHRNLRLEHLALDSNDNLKIIGWRRATTFFKPMGTTHSNLIAKREKRLRKNNHLPPEAFHHNYDPRSIDVWSYGVVLCSLATFRYPYKVMDRKTCLDVEQNWIDFRERHPSSFDKYPAIKSILDSIFIQEPMRRANISELQCSEFYMRPNKLLSLQKRFIRLN